MAAVRGRQGNGLIDIVERELKLRHFKERFGAQGPGRIRPGDGFQRCGKVGAGGIQLLVGKIGLPPKAQKVRITRGHFQGFAEIGNGQSVFLNGEMDQPPLAETFQWLPGLTDR